MEEWFDEEKEPWYQSRVNHIDFLTKTIVSLLKIGWSYNDEIVSNLHNERAELISEIEWESDSELLVKIWNHGKGKCHVYNRKEYLAKHK